MPDKTKIKAVFFDFMGTCLDWHSSVVKSMSAFIPADQASDLALNWRRLYFLENENRFQQNLPSEDIDLTLARALEIALSQDPNQPRLEANEKRQLIEAWHFQPAWPEVPRALRDLRDNLGLEVFVHANGTTRLQLDLARSSGLEFHMLFSSKLLGLYKPSLDAYRKALELVQHCPEEVVMVAAHAYDLRAAKKIGMRTIYIHRWTDDIDEDMNQVKVEFDFFLENMEELPPTIANM
ncbi:haloacid dehalogenase [Penicillium verhagenii]|uniref:haloacid dehalogenase n=1 Tax=Penicillium verhagenii TaxID=1562060 RepID=UPI002544E5D5|nr:haloacid dehalogenase [Penicillium verhagenii]KAJ5929923.1 haloacid dehalogenase [Penicillium verhagenii]